MNAKDSICEKCAKKRGYELARPVVGWWWGKCEFCGEEGGLTSLSHDWRKRTERTGGGLAMIMWFMAAAMGAFALLAALCG